MRLLTSRIWRVSQYIAASAALVQAMLFFNTAFSRISYPFTLEWMEKWISEIDQRKIRFKALLPVLVIIYLIVIVYTAWVSDDAFITFRSIENLVHGYGLVFNVGERVQTYTHPLWLLAQTLAYLPVLLFSPPFHLNRLFFINVLLSLSLSTAAVLVYAFRVARSSKAAILGLLALLLSKAFIDYSTSGLENPLNHLLLVGFVGLFLSSSPDDRKRVVAMATLAGLAVLNRLDVFLIVFPPLGYLWCQSKTKFRTGTAIMMGFIPVVLWEVFSLFYYGFLFPNTAYAKLNNDIRAAVLLKQGLHYFLNSFRLDPITLTLIAAAILAGLLIRKRRLFPLAAGLALYLLYVLSIGGDFMSGRYFSLPLLIAIIMLSEVDYSNTRFVISLAIVLVLGALPFLWGIERRPTYGDNRENNLVFLDTYKIADERLVYNDRTGLLTAIQGNSPKVVYMGESWQYTNSPTGTVELFGALGINAYRSGPTIHAIDRNGLADALMARMPLVDTENWRIGHFHHRIPDGYLETLEQGENLIADEHIAEFYDRLSAVIKGPLWDWGRIREIWYFNTWRYKAVIQ